MEPVYVMRSSKNTYMTKDDRRRIQDESKVQPWLNSDHPVAPLCRDIMLRTRALGKTVEAFF